MTGESLRLTPARPDDEVAIRLTAQGFGQEITPEFITGVIGVIDRCGGFQTLVGEKHDEQYGYIGYTCYDLEPGKVLYANTVMIDPGFQGSGLASRLFSAATRAEDADYVSFKTQSARMYAAAQKIFGTVFPDFTGGPISIPPDIQVVGESVAELRGGQFPIHRDSYDNGAMYDAEQVAASQPGFYRQLDLDAGDAVFCVCRAAGPPRVIE